MSKNITNADKGLFIGIDLGTTNSVLAHVNVKPNGEIVSKVIDLPRADEMYTTAYAETKLNSVKRPTLPSCVYYREENNYEPLVGDFAKKQYMLRPHLVARSIKSQMGNLEVDGLATGIPDKKPSDIAARILSHMVTNAQKIFRCPITDVVITVPANFDSAMCKATLDAARMAGIEVDNPDGSEKPVLLSEPNAVIYDLANQIKKGEISRVLLDLSTKKNVLVFDLGGGTLDITLHEIKQREEKEDVLKVEEIATNRYMLLGGDNFDEVLAEEMYKRYLKQYSKHGTVVNKLKQEKDLIMAQLRNYAEVLKVDLNSKCSEEFIDSSWAVYEEDEDEDVFPVGGGMGSVGYSYDDQFTKEEIENILSPFMAENLTYEDYKRMDTIKDTYNIIYPILDVLQKASQKLNVENVVVDAVIVNGGMSKFYMVRKRLKEFFGFEPIVALDPDQAVARGAAIYHYYLQKYREIEDDMRVLGETYEPILRDEEQVGTIKGNHVDEIRKLAASSISVEFGSTVLNDSLYLGVKNGAVHQLIPTGAELPYRSELMKGFQIEPGQDRIAIPIKSRNNDGTYRTIATGDISFTRKYPKGAFIVFNIYMSMHKIITLKAWTCNDEEGISKIESGLCEIDMGRKEGINKTKFVPPLGSILNPEEEIHSLGQLCKQIGKSQSKFKQAGSATARVSTAVSNIINASNKSDFARPILKRLACEQNSEMKSRLYTIARRIAYTWSDEERENLARIAYQQLQSELYGITTYGRRISQNIDAIYALSLSKNEKLVSKLTKLKSNPKYYQALLYTFGKTKIEPEWLVRELEKDVDKLCDTKTSGFQQTVYSVGLCFRKDEEKVLNHKSEAQVVTTICELMRKRYLNAINFPPAIIALGLICDQRYKNNKIKQSTIESALMALAYAEQKYSGDLLAVGARSINVAKKMINGIKLTKEEENFLLTRLEK